MPVVDKLNVREDTARVNVERIRERVQEDPFRPFAVVTSSGHKYPVPHMDFIFLTSKVVIIADMKGSTTGVDPLHVVALEDLPARGNGAQYRRRRRK
ncbi:MAG TPA: hypothetical protein VN829_23990 [Dongiaceae bacterium]|nr:hypothetical protein [Dongiaceae bacterium]